MHWKKIIKYKINKITMGYEFINKKLAKQSFLLLVNVLWF
jgi:hypothetical protein